jgi:hypothetical protein
VLVELFMHALFTRTLYALDLFFRLNLSRV